MYRDYDVIDALNRQTEAIRQQTSMMEHEFQRQQDWNNFKETVSAVDKLFTDIWNDLWKQS